MSNPPLFSEFCSWFPTLRHHKLDTPEKLQAHLRSPAMTAGSEVAAMFCLAIWNHYDYKFDVHAISRWDDQHLGAFARWAVNPFWY